MENAKMELIDLYVNEVGQHLPVKQRADLEAEIRSLVEDTVEGRSQAEGRPADEAMVMDVLKEFGSPTKVAAGYLPPRYLIGPRFYPTFMLVMRIILALIGVVALVQLGVALTAPGVTFDSGIRILGERVAQFLTSALAALGNIVFVFAILEWALPKANEITSAWDPRSLKNSRSDTDQPIRLFVVIWEIAFTVAFALILNLYPQWVGVGYMKDGHLTWLPVLSDTFLHYLPLINISWGLQIALNVLLLRAGRWETGTRWFKVGLEVLSLVILGVLISGAPIIDLPLQTMGIPAADANTLQTLAYNGLRILLVFIAVMEAINLGKLLLRLLYRKEQPGVIG
jgi:hypothetical protein